jgi:hypothetical protein
MTSYYSIIQLTSDPVADERINLGLIAIEGSETSLWFTKDAARPASFLGRQFGQDDIERLINDVREDLDATLIGEDLVDLVRGLADRWRRTVRITTPRASMLNLDELVSTVAPRAFPQWTRPESRKRARDRRTAIAIARRTLNAVLSQAPRAVRVQSNVTVHGQRQNHTLELGLANGAIRRGVSGLSFEGFSPDRERELDALKWMVDDVKTLDQSFPISVVVLSPEASGEAGNDLSVLASLGAELVQESELDQWAVQVVEAI